MKVNKLIRLYLFLKGKGVDLHSEDYYGVFNLSDSDIDLILNSKHVKRILELMLNKEFEGLSSSVRQQLFAEIDSVNDDTIYEIICESIDNKEKYGKSFIDVINTLCKSKTFAGAKAVMETAKSEDVRSSSDFVNILEAVNTLENEEIIDSVVKVATNYDVLSSDRHIDFIKSIINSSSKVIEAAAKIASSNQRLGAERCLKLITQLNSYHNLTKEQALKAVELIYDNSIVNSKKENMLESLIGVVCTANGINQAEAVIKMAKNDDYKLLENDGFIRYAAIVAGANMQNDFNYSSLLANIAINVLTRFKFDGDPSDYLKIICGATNISKAEHLQEFINEIDQPNDYMLSVLNTLSTPDGQTEQGERVAKIDKVWNSEHVLDIVRAVVNASDYSQAMNAYDYLELSTEEGDIDEEMKYILTLICKLENFKLPSYNISGFVLQDDCKLDFGTYFHVSRRHRDAYIKACSRAATSSDITRMNKLFNKTYAKAVAEGLKNTGKRFIDVQVEIPDYASCLEDPISFWGLFHEDSDVAMLLLCYEAGKDSSILDKELTYDFLVRKKQNKDNM